MKQHLKDLGLLTAYNAASLLISLILCSVLLHIDFLQSFVHIYFFRILIYTLISAAVFMASMFCWRYYRAKNNKNMHPFHDVKVIVTGFVICFLLIHSFLGVTTFTNDRSYTIFSLAYLYEHADTAFTEDEIVDIFINDFLVDFDAARKRIDEQLNTGFIEDLNGEYRISDNGIRFVRLLRVIDIFFPTETDPSSLYPSGNPNRGR